MEQNIITYSVSQDNQELFHQAQLAKEKAYCRYSKFPVGAALLTSNGKIYTGCNVENASYGLATCAERTAIVKAVSEGDKEFTKIAITTDILDSFTTPCGSCRQILAEFGLDLEIYLFKPNNEWVVYKLNELLPHAFTEKDLGKN